MTNLLVRTPGVKAVSGDQWRPPGEVQLLEQAIFFPRRQVRQILRAGDALNPEVCPIHKAVSPDLVNETTMVDTFCTSIPAGGLQKHTYSDQVYHWRERELSDLCSFIV